MEAPLENSYREPVARLSDLSPEGFDGLTGEGLAHFDALKFMVASLPGIDQMERDRILREFDMLRAGFLPFGQRPAVERMNTPLPSVADILRPRLHGIGAKLKLEGILGQNTQIVHALGKIARIAPTTLTVLLEGKIGSGKELFARIIHVNSGRDKLVSVNCSAIPAELVKSELFGHVRGAFTGASTTRKGKFEEASKGTLFLDEIGDLAPKAQAKLLRVLDLGEIQRVGSDQSLSVDVRIIAATNRNLEDMVTAGLFREDLYYRLNICHFRIPPLRERRDEILLLYQYFVNSCLGESGRTAPTFENDVFHYLFEVYPFPGNIRELKNLSLYIAEIFDGHPIGFADLPERYRRYYDAWYRQDTRNAVDPRQTARENAEKNFLLALLHQHQGNIPAVCRELSLSRSRVYQLLQKYGIRTTGFRNGVSSVS